jgi:beta-lactam-binding protein with PASTA domain
MVSTLSVPDLRGMTRSAARLTAQLRGLEVVVEGRGGVVIAQEPEPGEDVLVGVDIRCHMGEDVGYLSDVGELQSRQVRMLEILEDERKVSQGEL